MALILYCLALITSFYLLAEVSDRYFVVSLDQIAERLKMSHEMAGATLMAIGSSAPELFVAIISLVRSGDHAAIGVGTIVGSALFNILVIIGASAVVRNAKLMWQPVVRDFIFYALSVVALFVVLKDGLITWMESILLIFFYGGYLLTVMNWKRLFDFADGDLMDEGYEEPALRGWKKIFIPLNFLLRKLFPHPRRYILTFIFSILVIAFLCWVLVESAIGISMILEIPEVVIALTVLAIGTSIPDMISSVIVARQGRGGMAVSNAVGSNIFDILIGLGLPWLIMTLIKNEPILTHAEGLNESVILLFASVALIFITFVIYRWKVNKKLGYILIFIYVAYLAREIIGLYY
ncbi:calcium/sodium antiporter [Fulvivirga kasyanovii]|uniref:Calcium/sodium antiporter n=1 Tax=Fulvivirga kasyanovii TaxID=396812 RepID=A0ABW9RWH1_9BACT|nr:calcium/sodium antiporter [Fulvivirga kasyanovii]MTI28589.1 calcium/sodium antiporter [Fulvivirga kasyanovii]